MLTFTESDIAAFIQQYMLPFCRISGLFLAMPVIGTRLVPARSRVVMAFVTTLMVVPLLPPLPLIPLLSAQFAFWTVQELAIGVAVGFLFQVVFQVFVLAGQFIAMKLGLGFASMNDPTNGVQTTVLSQFYLMLVTLMFISINGHLVLIELLIQSFQTLPPGNTVFSAAKSHDIASMGAWLFASALIISLPILTGLLVVNIAFGIMSRAAPQLNIFAVGFPFTLICGMAMIWIGLNSFQVNFDQVIAEGFYAVHDLLETK